jgi:Tol biopolymer transport system component
MPAPGIINESMRVSPDSQRVAYVAVTNGRRQVWVRSIGALSAQPLPGTDNAANYLLGWAPDSRRLGFFADGKLKKIDISGGSAIAIANTTVSVPGAWNSNGDILFSALVGSVAPVIARVSDSGGEVTALTTIDSAAKEVMHVVPVFLPDGRRFVYARPTTAPDSLWQIVFFMGSLDSKTTTRLRGEGTWDPTGRSGTASPPVYVSSGYWLALVNGSLLAQRANADGSFGAGDQIRLAENVAGFTASEKLLLYRSAPPGAVPPPNSFSSLVWFDRSGKQAPAGAPGPYVGIDLSPDDRRVVATRGTLPATDLWVIDTDRGGQDRLTSAPGVEFFPVWSSDGREIVFASQGGSTVGPPSLYRRSSISVGGDKLLFKKRHSQ